MTTEDTQITLSKSAKVPQRPALGARRQIRGFLRDLWFKAFQLFEKFGVHVLPANFYTSAQI